MANFWEDYLKFEPTPPSGDDRLPEGLQRPKNGRYVISDDSVAEGSGADRNPIISLGLVRNLFETAIDMSRELGLDTGRHEKWLHILEHLSEFTTFERDGKTV